MKNSQRNEQQQADATVRILDSQNGGPLSDTEARTVATGQLIRQAATHGLPESNSLLRQSLMAELEEAESFGDDLLVAKPPVTQSSPNNSGRQRRVWWTVAAGTMLAAGTWSLYEFNHLDQRPAKVAMEYLSAPVVTNESPVDAAVPVPPIVWKSEPRNREVPVTGTREEMKKLTLADGSVVEKDINVPFTENVEQDYTVQAPATEMLNVTPRIVIAEEEERLNLAGKSFVDLPSHSVSEINSVVIVPDNGTVLRGGVKHEYFFEELPRQDAEGKDWLSRREKYRGIRSTDETAGNAPLTTNFGRLGWDSGTGGVGLGGMDMGGSANADGMGGVERFQDDDLAAVRRFGLYRVNERSSAETYAPIVENEFIAARGGEAISTFSIDVDTASYANMRRFLTSGQLPPRDSIRIEELVNYFAYNYPPPVGNDPFSVNMELAACPWHEGHKLLRIGIQGKDVHVDERPPTNVVFLLDVSGSMNSKDKLPLLKRGFQMLVNQLGENDRVSIVTYAGNAGVALEPTTGNQNKTINEAIERLQPGGSTHGSAGIELAYELAQKNFIQNGVNKVILATDGDLNVGVTDDGALVKLITQKASEGVFLTVLGFGTGNLKDGKMEKLADNGNGMYAYIDSIREAHKVLVEQMSGSLVTIAKDVKIQIEFNPAEVSGYRLLGYENRMLATEDFDNDQKDAGEIGAGHTVTAIYEIVPVKQSQSATSVTPQGMKYQTSIVVEPTATVEIDGSLSEAAQSGELATLALRYKQPDSNTSKRLEFAIKNDERSFASGSDDFRFAASVAAFGMLLRGSEFSGTATAGLVEEIAVGAMNDDQSGYRAEFVDLIRRAGELCN